MTDFTSMTQDIKEIKTQLSDLRVAIASLPEKMFEKSDCRYAFKNVEDEVKNIKLIQDSRTYDWLKIAVMLVLTIVLTLIFGKYTHIGL